VTQDERLEYLIHALLRDPACAYAIGGPIDMPASRDDRRLLLRALMNVRMPQPASEEFLTVQDAYLKERLVERGVTHTSDLHFNPEGIAVWCGDITTLAVDAIVNAANSQMLGCFVPNHRCIDNAIHTYAGIQLRLACKQLMDEQGHEEPTGTAKLTPGFNLPAAHVLHTVGPIVPTGIPSSRDRKLLASCYRSCLELAAEHGLRSIALCCISTGEFRYPNRKAAQVAIDTVRAFRCERPDQTHMEVVFNVFKPVDEQIYRDLLASR
jgi:O-acetyl-ADP-ribose deacetylase (regulator of RNase III)